MKPLRIGLQMKSHGILDPANEITQNPANVISQRVANGGSPDPANEIAQDLGSCK